jgi:hypothetical protein
MNINLQVDHLAIQGCPFDELSQRELVQAIVAELTVLLREQRGSNAALPEGSNSHLIAAEPGASAAAIGASLAHSLYRQLPRSAFATTREA